MKVSTAAGSLLACLYSSSYHSLFLISSFSKSQRVLSLANTAFGNIGKQSRVRQQQLFSTTTTTRDHSSVSFIRSKYTHPLFILSRGGDTFQTSKSTSLFSTTTTSDMLSSSAISTTPPIVYRTDYKPLDYVVTDVQLSFDIQNGRTIVRSELTIVPNVTSDATTEQLSLPPMILDGDETSIQLQTISMNGRELQKDVVSLSRRKVIYPWYDNETRLKDSLTSNTGL
jgi:hypothetical protein